MNNLLKIKYISISILSFFVAMSFAYAQDQDQDQDQDKNQDLDFDEIQVVAPYKPTVSEAFKIIENPKLEDTISMDIDMDYTIKPLKINTDFEVDPINPARMRGEPLTKLYKGLAKAGIGTHSTPYAEVFYNTLRSNEYAYGVRAKHLSSSGEIEDYEYSQYSKNLIDVYGKKFYRNNITLNADLNYNRDMVHYYGFHKDDFVDNEEALETIQNIKKSDIKQSFNIFKAGINYHTSNLDSSKLDHSAAMYYRYMFDKYDLTEQLFSLKGHIGKQLPPDPLGYAEKQYFKLSAKADFVSSEISENTTNKGLISLEPKLYSQYNVFKFYIGLNVTTQIDKNTYLKFYPQAHAEASIVKNVLIAYGTFSGGMEKYDYYSVSKINPYINTGLDIPMKFMNKKADLTGGFKGSISSYVAYNFSISNTEIEDYAFFVNDTTEILNNKFTLVYDNIRRFNFRAEIFTQISEKFRLRLASDYYEYALDNEIEAWHLPTVVVSAGAQYNIQDKVILSLDALARNTTYARGFDNNDNPIRIELEGFHVDTNVSLEYRYTKRLSVFLNFNNIQNQSLEKWMHYPTQKFNFLGGVNYAF